MSGRELPRAERLDAFYRAYRLRLWAAARAASTQADDAVIADACGFAWLTLVRRPDIDLDRGGFGWVVTVAIHEVWHLLALAKREHAAGTFRLDGDDRELPEPEGPATDPLDCVMAREIHRERMDLLATIKPRERRDLLLHAAGYRYVEIAKLTNSTYTAVNRRLTKGRRRLRAAACV